MSSIRLLTRLGWFGAGLMVLGTTINQCLYDVDGGQRAVIFDKLRGVIQTVSGEGTHFLIPFIQTPIMFSIRCIPRSVRVETGSKDLQTVDVTLRILYHPLEQQLVNIYRNLGIEYADKVLPSISTEVLKSIIAEFDASELITQREGVCQRITDLLSVRAANFGIALDDISITHLTFGLEFTKAVEQKQVAQQEAEKARFIVEKAQQLKLANIISTEGDALSAEIIANALKESGDYLIELRRIEAAEDIANSLAKSRNIAYLPGGGERNLLIQIPPT